MAQPLAATSGALYLFVGPDRARKRERLAILIQELGVDVLDQQILPAQAWSARALAGTIRQQPIASPTRLVVIEDAEQLDAACLALFADIAWRDQPTCVVLCADGLLQASPSLAALAAEASVESFDWLPVADAQRWITGYVARLRKTITPEAVRALTHTVGTDTMALRGVLDQLLMWVGARPQITAADLETFVTPAAPATNTFALVNALAQRDMAAAVQAFHEQLASGKDALEVLGLMIWQVQRWLLVSQLLQAGCADSRIEQVTGIKAWQLGRLRSELAGRPPEHLRQVLRQCWELDVAAKRGQIPLVGVAVEMLVVRMCLSEPQAVSQTARRANSPALSPVGA